MMHAHPHKAGNNVATPRDLTNSLNALKMKRMHLHFLKIDLNPLLAMEASTYEHPPCKLLEACWCSRWRICFSPFVPFFALLRVMLKLVQLFLSDCGLLSLFLLGHQFSILRHRFVLLKSYLGLWGLECGIRSGILAHSSNQIGICTA